MSSPFEPQREPLEPKPLEPQQPPLRASGEPVVSSLGDLERHLDPIASRWIWELRERRWRSVEIVGPDGPRPAITRVEFGPRALQKALELVCFVPESATASDDAHRLMLRCIRVIAERPNVFPRHSRDPGIRIADLTIDGTTWFLPFVVDVEFGVLTIVAILPHSPGTANCTES